MKARTTFLILLPLLLVGIQPAAADEHEDASLDPNLRVTLTIGNTEQQSGFRERNYRTIARPRQQTNLMMGWRTPIPTKRREVTAEGDEPMTAFTYQNIGVSGVFDIELVGDDILMHLQVEVSGPRGGADSAVRATAPPIIGTFQQELVVMLADGKPLRIAEVPDHEGGALYLEITAKILD